jgi:hypothetical protein
MASAWACSQYHCQVNVKVKLSLFWNNYALRHEDVCGSGGTASSFCVFFCSRVPCYKTICNGNRVRATGTANSYWLDKRGVGIRVSIGSKTFFSYSLQTGSGAYPASKEWVPWALSSALKRKRRESDRSPPISAKDRKMWIYTYNPQSPIGLHGVVLN